MAEYENRERAYATTMGDLFGAFVRHVIEGDNEAKDSYVRRIQALADVSNMELNTKASLVGLPEVLETSISVPPTIIAPIEPILIDDAGLAMHMEVSAHQESASELKSETEIEGGGSANIGPFFKAKMNIKANVSVAKSQKRASDYRATTDVHVSFKQGQVPEGVARIVDSVNKTVTKALEINERLIELRAQQLHAAVDAAQASGELPASGAEEAPPMAQGE